MARVYEKQDNKATRLRDKILANIEIEIARLGQEGMELVTKAEGVKLQVNILRDQIKTINKLCNEGDNGKGKE